ncbi:MAG: response regulator [Planctomycetota bacterium]|nr:response regulator [Planctomycetota bacterium]
MMRSTALAFSEPRLPPSRRSVPIAVDLGFFAVLVCFGVLAAFFSITANLSYYFPAVVSNQVSVRLGILPADLSGDEVIMLVEDDDEVRELTREILVSRGYEVLSASTGSEALELLSRFECKIHVLLTDMIMPNMNGRDLYVETLKERPGLKVLFMSGYSEDIAEDSFECGSRFIEKPFTYKGLCRKVREILDDTANEKPGA